VGNADDDDAPYQLAGAATGKAKAGRVRENALPGAGVSARGVAEAAAPTRKTLTSKRILAAFGGKIEPVRPTPLYRLWVVIVAGVMVLLPLIYVAMIGLVGAGVVYHAVNNSSMISGSGVHGRGFRWVLMLYVTPMIAGAVVIMMMLKPLFARPARGPKQRVLDPGEEPMLHAFVDGVCASVNAPRPARIAIDCQVNASASRQGGILGVIGGDLVLTVGLPLVAGLTLKQFAGVLAHEFGHFSQGAGMRLYGLIMRINMWFARLVYERDQWDEWIASVGADNQGGYLILLGLIMRLAVWLTRRILWVLMQLGHVASGFLSRQMEFDADRYEARMVGGEVYAETMWQIRVMNLAASGAYSDLSSSWQERRLPDNFPKLVVANIPQLSQELLKTYRESMESERTGLFSTHPADKDRIARARREEPGPGIFHLDGPATDVFRDFDVLARSASFTLYRESLGNDITKDQLFTVSELVATQTAAQEGVVAAGRLFLGAWDLTKRLPLPLQYPSAPADLEAAKAALAQARADLQAARAECVAARKREDEPRTRLYQAEVARIFVKTDVKFKPADFQLSEATVPAAESARDRAEAQLKKLEAAGETFTSAAAARLVRALALFEAEPVAALVADGAARRDESLALYPCAAQIGASVVPRIGPLILARSVLAGTLQAYEAGKDPKNERLVNAVLRAAAALHERLYELRSKISYVIDYPFDHASEDVSLGKFVFPNPAPEKNDVGGLMGATDDALNRLSSLYQRALGRLAVTVEEVERALGMAPIVIDEAGDEET
jgi:Zn-dependent protease with chaperone function